MKTEDYHHFGWRRSKDCLESEETAQIDFAENDEVEVDDRDDQRFAVQVKLMVVMRVAVVLSCSKFPVSTVPAGRLVPLMKLWTSVS